MIFHIRFSFPGCCFVCNCSAAIGSGIHFRAVGLLIPKSRAHFDTLPPGCSAYFVPAVASESFWRSPAGYFFRLAISLYKNKPGGVGFVLRYSSRTLSRTTRRPMGSRRSCLLRCCLNACGSSQGKGAAAQWHNSTLERQKAPEM